LEALLAELEAKPIQRVLTWRGALETIGRRPVFGRGVGLDICSVHYLNPSGHAERLGDAHNTFLNAVCETGLVGLFALLCVVAFVIKSCQPSSVRGAARRVVMVCLALALIDAFFYQSLTGSYEDMRHLWMLFGMVVAVKGDTRGDKTFTPEGDAIVVS